VCDDYDWCTRDYCDPYNGCQYVDISPCICDDDNLCTTDVCDSSEGCINSPISCDDSDSSTYDWCNPATGQCQNSPVATSAAK